MQGFWNKLFNIWCESYQVGVSNVTGFRKTETHIATYLKRARACTHARTDARPRTHTRAHTHAHTRTQHTHTHMHTQTDRGYCSTDIDLYSHMTYLWPTWQIHVPYQLMWWGKTVSYICQSEYKLGWMANKIKRGDYNYNRDNASRQYPYCHTQFQALQCADNRQVQHTKIHQFTGDRTGNTKCGNQYRLQFLAFYIVLWNKTFLWRCRPTGTINCTWHIRQ